MTHYSSLDGANKLVAVHKAGHESIPEVDAVPGGIDLLGDVLGRIVIYRSKMKT